MTTPHPLLNSFADYILNKDALDLNLIKIVHQNDTIFQVRRGFHPTLFRLSLIFLIPCLFLLLQLFTHFHWILLITAMVVCPILMTVVLIFNFTWIEQTYDLKLRTWKQTVKLPGLTKNIEGTLPVQGTIALTSVWARSGSSGASHTGSSGWKYKISVTPACGFTYSVARTYPKALAFAEQLSKTLGYPLSDTTEKA